jgi:hypothetical protein
LEGQIGGMDQRDGLEGWSDKRMEGCRIVVLILFSRNAKFSYFRQKSIFAKSKIFAFSWAIFVKNENDFVRIFAKIYFRPNSICRCGQGHPRLSETVYPVMLSINMCIYVYFYLPSADLLQRQDGVFFSQRFFCFDLDQRIFYLSKCSYTSRYKISRRK